MSLDFTSLWKHGVIWAEQVLQVVRKKGKEDLFSHDIIFTINQTLRRVI